MSGFRNALDTEQQTAQDLPNALPVTHVTMLGISIAGILQAGGTWPPVGTTQPTESVTQPRNALPAICTTKDGSGISVNELTALSAEELQRLCDSQKITDRIQLQNLENCTIDIKERLTTSAMKRLQSYDDQQKLNRIRKIRRKLEELYKQHNSKSQSIFIRKAYRDELYILTGYHGYYRT